MSDSYHWGKLHVYNNDGYLRVYYWDKMTMYRAKLTLNKDNSVCVEGEGKKLLPSMFWHHLGEQSPKIITYLMLKRK